MDSQEEVETRLVQDWDRIKKWAHCFCLINFDLKLGQVFETSYPPNALSPNDQNTVCNMSFPDSNSTKEGDFVFCFKYRNTTNPKDAGVFSYGYVFFRQQKDPSIHRGYFQKSIVLISGYPFVQLYEELIRILGPMFFEFGTSVLEVACKNIADWPSPFELYSGHDSPYPQLFELPFMGSVLHFALDVSIESPFAKLFIPNGSADNHPKLIRSQSASGIRRLSTLRRNGYDIVGCFRFINVYKQFREVVGNLWCLWELALVGEPILVIAPDTVSCSHAVLGILSLISPIPYKGDFRPYFTVSDPDYKYFEDMYDHNSLPCVVLGATNPFFVKRFPDFPHLLLIGPPSRIEQPPRDRDVFPGFFGHRRRGSMEENIRKKISTDDSVIGSDFQGQLISQKAPLLQANKELVKTLLRDTEEDLNKKKSKRVQNVHQVAEINNTLIRNHFLVLTTRFLAPFEFFFRPIWSKVAKKRLAVLKGDSNTRHSLDESQTFNPYLEGAKFAKFDETKFIEKIKNLNTNDILKHFCFKSMPQSSLASLYERFFKSPHFYPWLSTRREDSKSRADDDMKLLIMSIDIKTLLKSLNPEKMKKTAESITFFLQRYLAKYEEHDKEFVDRLGQHLDIVSKHL